MIRGSITVNFDDHKDPEVSFKGIVDVNDIPKVNYFIKMAYQLNYLDPRRQEELKAETANKAKIAEEQKIAKIKAEESAKLMEKAKAEKAEQTKKELEAKQAKIKQENELVEAQRILTKANQPAKTEEQIKWAKDILAKKDAKVLPVTKA